jgi:hypothetical protein
VALPDREPGEFPKGEQADDRRRGAKRCFGDDRGRVAASAAARSQAPRFGPGRGYMPPRRNALFSAKSDVLRAGRSARRREPDEGFRPVRELVEMTVAGRGRGGIGRQWPCRPRPARGGKQMARLSPGTGVPGTDARRTQRCCWAGSRHRNAGHSLGERDGAGCCKTAGSAYVGSNPTPATRSVLATEPARQSPCPVRCRGSLVSGHVRPTPTTTGRPCPIPAKAGRSGGAGSPWGGAIEGRRLVYVRRAAYKVHGRSFAIVRDCPRGPESTMGIRGRLVKSAGVVCDGWRVISCLVRR